MSVKQRQAIINTLGDCSLTELEAVSVKQNVGTSQSETTGKMVRSECRTSNEFDCGGGVDQNKADRNAAADPHA